MKKTNKKGFTIVELVIVIAVIAILAAVLIPTFAGVVERANKSAAIQAARNAYTEILAYENATLGAGDEYNLTTGVKTPSGESALAADNDLKAIGTETGVSAITVTSTSNITFTVGSKTVTYNTASDPIWSCN